MRQINHPCLVKLVGANLDIKPFLLTEFLEHKDVETLVQGSIKFYKVFEHCAFIFIFIYFLHFLPWGCVILCRLWFGCGAFCTVWVWVLCGFDFTAFSRLLVPKMENSSPPKTVQGNVAVSSHVKHVSLKFYNNLTCDFPCCLTKKLHAALTRSLGGRRLPAALWIGHALGHLYWPGTGLSTWPETSNHPPRC